MVNGSRMTILSCSALLFRALASCPDPGAPCGALDLLSWGSTRPASPTVRASVHPSVDSPMDSVDRNQHSSFRTPSSRDAGPRVSTPDRSVPGGATLPESCSDLTVSHRLAGFLHTRAAGSWPAADPGVHWVLPGSQAPPSAPPLEGPSLAPAPPRSPATTASPWFELPRHSDSDTLALPLLRLIGHRGSSSHLEALLRYEVGVRQPPFPATDGPSSLGFSVPNPVSGTRLSGTSKNAPRSEIGRAHV